MVPEVRFLLPFFLVTVAVSWGGLKLSEVHGIAAIWLADAIVLAVLLRVPKRQWAVWLLTAAFGCFVGNEINRAALLTSLVLPVCNMVSLLAVALVLRRLWGGPPHLSRNRMLIEFCVVGGAIAPAVSASLAALYFSALGVTDVTALWRTWFLACALGILTLGPPLLSFSRETLRSILRPDRLRRIWTTLVVLAATVAFVFLQEYQILLFLLFPALLLAAFRLNFLAVTLASVLTVAIALGLTLAGYGPFQPSAEAGLDVQVQLLQLLLAGAILTTLPVASALAEREQLQRRLREAMTEAQHANQAKSEFLANMSHELRTPLNAIIGFAQMMTLNKSALSEKQTEYVGYIQGSGNQLLSLINDVLDFSRIEAGDIRVDLSLVEVEGLLNEVAATICPQAAEKGLILSVDPVRSVPPIIVDRARVLQVLLNLCSNAVKYNRPNGALGLRAERMGRWVRITVADTGYGIPRSRQREVFQPFNRLGAEGRSIEGTGIGLSICWRLVQVMQGRIGFVSEQGQGSEFWVDLPLAERKAIGVREQLNSPVLEDDSRRAVGA